MSETALYPGTFDPVTNGHLDIIKRAAPLFDRLIVGIIHNPVKTDFTFTIEERQKMVAEAVKKFPGIEIMVFEGLLVDFARQQNVNIIIRGLRAISDFEYEFQMALTNKKINAGIETLFMMASEEHSYLSSRLVKEIALFDGDVSKFVPAVANSYLINKFKRK